MTFNYSFFSVLFRGNHFARCTLSRLRRADLFRHVRDSHSDALQAKVDAQQRSKAGIEVDDNLREHRTG
jgi:hypothetical protein